MKLGAIIVEDEEKTRELLLQRINEWQPNIEVLDTCADAKEAILSIVRHKPQVVFLDIFIPDINGFEFFGIIEELNITLQCIIVTGHAEPEYFREAVRLGLTDFLLKPIKKEELNRAVENVMRRIANGKHLTNIRDLYDTMQYQKINLPIFNGAISLFPDQILYASSNGKYSELFLSDGSKETINKSISELEIKLQPFYIIRIDRFTLINPRYLHKVAIKLNKVYLSAKDKIFEVSVSKPGIEKVFELMK